MIECMNIQLREDKKKKLHFTHYLRFNCATRERVKRCEILGAFVAVDAVCLFFLSCATSSIAGVIHLTFNS